MTEVIIVRSLVLEIKKKFNRAEANKIIDLMQSLEDNPCKGKKLGSVGRILIKEIKYKNFRFYFLADGYKFKLFSRQELADVLLKFVRMSDKKHQKQVVGEIRQILLEIGPPGLD